MPEIDTQQLTQLRNQIEENFSEEELRALCFDLGVDFENLGGRGKAANVLELINWAKRNNCVSDLMALVKEARPHVPDIIALLPPHHIPYRRNELFTGREAWQTKLHDALHQDEPIAVTQAVAGLGGVGKTQLALAYCYRHLNDYDLIQWLRADDAVTLGGELAELAYRLGLARRSVTDQPALHQLALNWLHTTDKRWLLVYDNADAIQPNDLRPFLPKMGRGACLITSRNPNWGGLAHTLNLTHFDDAEAVAFLLGQPEMASEEMEAHPQAEDAKSLAHLLGNLPLALEHARAYVEETGCTLADYAGYFANERVELWGDDLPAPADYDEKTITTTWELAFAQVRQTLGAAELLNLCCFLAPDDIPLNVLMAAVGSVDEPPLPQELVALAESKLKLDKAIVALRRYSLLTRDGVTLTLHRLVQTVARDQMPLEIKQTYVEVAVLLLQKAFPYSTNDMTTWEGGSILLPHAAAATGFALNLKVASTLTASLLNHMGQFLDDRGQYTAAEINYKDALALCEEVLGPEHIYTAVCLNNIGNLLRAVGKYEVARPYLERALKISVEVLGPDHPTVAIRLNNLAALFQTVGEWEAARPILERALSILEKNLSADHPYLAVLNNNLGHLLQTMGEYGAALVYLERALAISERVLGPDHPQVATANTNLGLLLKTMGDYKAARLYYERALAIDEKTLGSEHPSVATDLNNLGRLLLAVGEYHMAREYLERTVSILDAALPNHPNTAGTKHVLAELLAKMEGQ
ncbi:tetratricopeptide repeat protein [Candidatus Leptofilum sp.]|uniref:tetratricopeptide repeat protein n=1 Tax=Candidatus Leptofilum sp. TaxID=3241576 RepID=UPI003B5BAFD0